MNAMTAAAGLEDMVAGRGWLPDFFDARAVRFVRASREEVARATFLDPRFTEDRPAIGAPLADVRVMAGRLGAPPPPAFVFHTAFCGSTLLCRALDAPGRTRALKEPFLLVREANEQRRGGALDLDLACRLLALSADGERALVKPTNAANNLAPHLLDASSNAKALILHGDLHSFLIAMLSAREDRRSFARKLFRAFGDGHQFVRQFPPQDLLLLPDMKITAFTWRLQTEPLFEAARRHPGRVASLSVDRLMAAPAQALRAAADWLELDADDVDFQSIADGPVFAAHAKNTDRAFDPRAQAEERRRIEELHGADALAACDWARRLPFGGGDVGDFPNPLAL